MQRLSQVVKVLLDAAARTRFREFVRRATCIDGLASDGAETHWAAAAEVIVFDFDGVLAPHGSSALDAETVAQLTALNAIGPHKLILLSNRADAPRDRDMENKCRFIGIVTAAKKPSPAGLVAIQATTQSPMNKICLVDDRLLTGGLAAYLAGANFVYFTPPNVSANPSFKEHWFGLLRKMERAVFL
jgi:predicted HAD superfamily phosphohydrolase YqeG